MPCLGSRILSCTPWKQSISIAWYNNTALVSAAHHLTLSRESILYLATKVGAIVAGQTSVKAPEKAAFESHLPTDVHIVSLHSLHGPTVSPVGQPLVRAWLPRRSHLSFTHDSHLTPSSRSLSSIAPQKKASGSSRAYSGVSNRAMSTSHMRIMTLSPPMSKPSLTLPFSRTSPLAFATDTFLCLSH